MASELARSIAAVFLPADWRRWTHNHYQKLEIVDELLHHNTTDVINRADAIRVIQDARERGGHDLRELISELKTLPATYQDERRAVITYLERFDGSELLPMLIADIKAGRHRTTTTKGER